MMVSMPTGSSRQSANEIHASSFMERRGVTAGVVGVARRERVVKLERVRALIADITIEGRWGGGAVGRKSENGTSSRNRTRNVLGSGPLFLVNSHKSI